MASFERLGKVLKQDVDVFFWRLLVACVFPIELQEEMVKIGKGSGATMPSKSY